MSINWNGFPETIALALAGLMALAVVAPLDTNATSCLNTPVRDVEYRMSPVAPANVEDDMLRDMLLHD